eukprot:SAG11_NODE_12485_length_701_cov_0.911960_2_plen_103_part_01
MLVTEIMFAALTFPAIEALIDVFSCTQSDVYKKDYGNITRVCQVDDGQVDDGDIYSCMDVLPAVKCWGTEHNGYIALVMLVLVPYFLGSMFLRSDAQAKSSAV